VIAKTTRNAMIGFVVLGYAIYWARKAKQRGVANKAAFLWQKFPNSFWAPVDFHSLHRRLLFRNRS